MNTVKVIIKIAAALAAVAGVVFVIAAYGDKIVAWAKKLLGSHSFCDGECSDCDSIDVIGDFAADDEDESPAAGVTVVASDADFEG